MPKNPFPRERRVRKHSEFQRAQTGGAAPTGRATSAHFVFLVAPSPKAGELSRLGIVVTKKIGSAVERNRVKRVCRDCFRLWPDFVAPGVDLIVIAKQGAPLLGLSQVREEWGRARGALQHRVREVLARTANQPHVSPRSTS